ncbi:hypothetical protein YC2023_090250 [Brassica napus]
MIILRVFLIFILLVVFFKPWMRNMLLIFSPCIGAHLEKKSFVRHRVDSKTKHCASPLLLRRTRMALSPAMARSMSTSRLAALESAPDPRPALTSLTTSFGVPVNSS